MCCNVNAMMDTLLMRVAIAINVLKVWITIIRSLVETFYPHLSRTHFNFYLDKTTNKPTDKTTTDQPTDIPTNNPNKNSTETTINPTEKPTNEPTDNPTNKPTDKQCNGDEKCTADDVNSYCNTDTGACECKKGFTADEASDKCVKGMYHSAIISIWNYYPQPCTYKFPPLLRHS